MQPSHPTALTGLILAELYGAADLSDVAGAMSFEDHLELRATGE